MTSVHLILGTAALLATLTTVIVGACEWRGGGSRAFWLAARTGQGLIAVQVLLGLLLLMIGNRPHAVTHPLFGFGALVALIATETARVRAGDAALERVDLDAGRRRDENGREVGASHADVLRAGRAEVRATTIGSALVFALVLAAGASGL